MEIRKLRVVDAEEEREELPKARGEERRKKGLEKDGIRN